MPTESPALAIVIPTWNGLELLRQFLPSVMAEARRWSMQTGQAHEIIISDDGSRDGSAAWLAEQSSVLRAVSSPQNRGFAAAANAGVFAARAPIIVLLNNDVVLPAGALDPVLASFADDDIFGITFRGLSHPAAQFETGGKLGIFRRGFWSCWRNYDMCDTSAPVVELPDGPSFMLTGGFCAFRRAGFEQLGGFDPIFAPYYWEDVDLSYRARKRGWRVLYEPRIQVHHMGQATTRRHRTPWRRAIVIERNRLLFHWRNLDSGPLAWHLLWAHLLLPQMALRGDFAYHAGYAQALRRLPEVFRFRRREIPHWRRPDRDLAVLPPPGAISGE